MTQITKSHIRYIRSLSRKKERDAAGVFVAEGQKCVEMLLPDFEPVMVIATEERLPAIQSHVEPRLLYEATVREIEQMSTLRAPQGVIAVFKQKKQDNLILQQYFNNDILLALDGVQDPGNLGTIIRTADWFGISDIVCSTDTADCWNTKVVQATMGSLARVRLHYLKLPQWLNSITSHHDKPPVYGTLLNGKNIYNAHAIADRQRGVIIMGNEGNGISEEVRKYITHPILIPAVPHADNNGSPESLNVSTATAIILAEFRRDNNDNDKATF